MIGILAGYIIYAWVVVGLAVINKDIRDYKIKHGDPTQLNHTLWAIIWLALLVPSWFIFHNWWLVAALFVQRLWIFSPVFNLLIDMPPFNLSKTTKSAWDQWLIKHGIKSTEWITLLAFCVSVGLLIKSMLNG